MSTLARISIEDFNQLAETGVFENQRIELIDGELRDMSPIGPKHEEGVDRLAKWSFTSLPLDEVRIRVQSSIGLDRLKGVPQPDIAWIREKSYLKGRPTARDVLLIIEVADASLAFDLGEKADHYARAGIREYWVVNVVGCWIEVCRQPKRGKYASRERFGIGDVISPHAFPHVKLEIAWLFAA